MARGPGPPTVHGDFGEPWGPRFFGEPGRVARVRGLGLRFASHQASPTRERPPTGLRPALARRTGLRSFAMDNDTFRTEVRMFERCRSDATGTISRAFGSDGVGCPETHQMPPFHFVLALTHAQISNVAFG